MAVDDGRRSPGRSNDTIGSGLPGTPYTDQDYEGSVTPDAPGVFFVTTYTDRAHVKISVGQGPKYRGRMLKRALYYRIYWIPGTLLSDTDAKDPEKFLKAFGQAEMVVTERAPINGATISVLTVAHVGEVGWWLATSVNRDEIESPPCPPFPAPTGSDVNDAIIPSDPSACSAQLVPMINRGLTTDIQVRVSAVRPPEASFAGYQIYIWNFGNQGQLWEGPFFSVQNIAAGGVLSGTFTIEPDAPMPLASAGLVNATNGSPTINQTAGSPVSGWNAAWANSNQAISIIDGANPRAYWSRYIVACNPATPSITLDIGFLGTTGSGYPYMVYSVPLSGVTFTAPHPVRLYFIAVSKAGTRRADPLNAPFYEFPFGFCPQLTAPLQPVNLVGVSTGTTITLTWQHNTPGTSADTTTSHFNIYRDRAGTYPTAPTGTRPISPFATVKFDQSIPDNGTYMWVDRAFDTDPTSGTWDFDPRNPGEYDYWITAVNINGLENTQAIPTTGNIILQGNTGAENDPTIYRDNQWNRLYNAKFASLFAVAPGGNVALSKANNANIAATARLVDGQLMYGGWDPGKDVANGGTGFFTYVAGTPPAGDPFCPWEYLIAGTGVIPALVFANVADLRSTGEVLLDPGAGAGAGDYSVLWQECVQEKYLRGENVVLSFYGKLSGAAGTAGLIRMQVGWYDTTNGENVNGVDFSTSNLTASYQRYSLITTMPAYAGIRNDTVAIAKIGVVGGTTKMLASMPMVNGGKLGAQWTPIMNPQDAPGSTGGGSTGGSPIDPNQPAEHCLVAGALVTMADGTEKPIQDVRIGERVLAFDGEMEPGHARPTSKVKGISVSEGRELVHVMTREGNSATCTPKHRFAGPPGKYAVTWQRAEDLKTGDLLLIYDDDLAMPRFDAVCYVERQTLDTPTKVYELALEPHHNFWSNGILSHNLKPQG